MTNLTVQCGISYGNDPKCATTTCFVVNKRRQGRNKAMVPHPQSLEPRRLQTMVERPETTPLGKSPDQSRSTAEASTVTVEDILTGAAEQSNSTSGTDCAIEVKHVTGKLVSKHVPPRLWSLFVEDGTGSVRASFLDPDISHLGCMVTLTSWRRVGAANAPTPAIHGQASEASAPSSSRARSKAQAPEEGVYVEVSEYEAGQAGRKRPRQDDTSQQCKEGLRACGVCVAVTPLVSKPSPWVLVLLEIDGPRGSRIGVLLEGQCLHWHPFLRVGAAYRFPLVTVAKEGEKHGAQVLRAAEGHTPQRLPPLSQGQAGLFENATGMRWVDVKAVSPPLPSLDDLPPSAAVLNYEGTIRALHMGSLFELEVLPDGRRFYLLLAHDLPALGAGLRPGARVRLDNVHPLCLWGQVQALGACLFSQVRVLSFSDRSPSEAPYKLPDKNTYTRYCLTLLEWSRRLRVSLRDKVVGRGGTQGDWFESGLVRPWSKRLASFSAPDRSDMHGEVLYHECGRCPVPLGGLSLQHDNDHTSLSPPLPALPRMREVWRAIQVRLETMWLVDKWVGVLQYGPYARRDAFTLSLSSPLPSVSGDGLLRPGVVVGQLSLIGDGPTRRQLVLQDASGALALALVDRGTGQLAVPDWVMEQARANAALDGKATGEQHKDLVGLRLEDITVICQVVGRSSKDTKANESGEAAGLTFKVPLPGCKDSLVHVTPYLLACPSALMTVANHTPAQPHGLRQAGWSYEVAAPPDCVPVAEVLGSVDVAQVRAEPRKPWQVSQAICVTIVTREERGQAVQLYCRALGGCDVILIRLPSPSLTPNSAGSAASHGSAASSVSRGSSMASPASSLGAVGVGEGGVCFPPLAVGCVLAFRGLRCDREGQPPRRVAFTITPKTTVHVLGFRPVGLVDYRLAHLSYLLPMPTAIQDGRSLDEEQSDPFYCMPLGRLSRLTCQDKVCYALVTLIVTVMVFSDVKLVVACSRCKRPHREGADRLVCPNGAPLFKWELQAKVDDGTGQAMVWADGEAAVQLLGLRDSERRQFEIQALTASASDPAWLRRGLFAQPSAPPRRLRRIRLTAREVLDHRGKGDKKPPPTVRLRHEGQGGAKLWTFHMPVLKALHATEVHTMQQRQAAYALLRELQGTEGGGREGGK